MFQGRGAPGPLLAGGVDTMGDSVNLEYENDGLRNPDSGERTRLETLKGTSGKFLGFNLSSGFLGNLFSQLSRMSEDGKFSLLYNHLL